MGKSRNPNTYSDVAAVLDAVLASGGEATYTADSPAAAVVFRARANHLRLLLRDLAAETLPPGFAPSSKYDHLVLRLKKDSCEVQIGLRKPTGALTLPNGTPIPIKLGRDVQRDPLQDEVEDLLKGLGE